MKTTAFAGLLLSAICILFYNDAAAQYRHNDRYNFSYHRQSYRDYGYAYHRPYATYSYPRYYSPRPGVSIVARVPFGAVVVHIGNTRYHYYRGTFYRPYGPQFMIATPPVGIIVPVLPPDCTEVLIGGRRCYYYSGTYYQPLAGNQGYQVIEGNSQPQVSKNEPAADDGYEKVVIDGKTYYKKGDTYYKANVSDSGEITYEAVGATGKQ